MHADVCSEKCPFYLFLYASNCSVDMTMWRVTLQNICKYRFITMLYVNLCVVVKKFNKTVKTVIWCRSCLRCGMDSAWWMCEQMKMAPSSDLYGYGAKLSAFIEWSVANNVISPFWVICRATICSLIQLYTIRNGFFPVEAQWCWMSTTCEHQFSGRPKNFDRL